MRSVSSPRMMRALCPIMPGLCSVGWRLVSIKSPSSMVRYTTYARAVQAVRRA